LQAAGHFLMQPVRAKPNTLEKWVVASEAPSLNCGTNIKTCQVDKTQLLYQLHQAATAILLTESVVLIDATRPTYTSRTNGLQGADTVADVCGNLLTGRAQHHGNSTQE
jgi:hypothetical protein